MDFLENHWFFCY